MSNSNYLSSPKEFHLEMPLYYVIDMQDESTSQVVHSLMTFAGTVDAYCVFCEKDSVFNTDLHYSNTFNSWQYADNGVFMNQFSCSRNASHAYRVYYLKTEKSFQKIGQYPSIADFQIPQVEKYRRILGEEKHKEFVRAIGLSAHGIGIGAFVYLRRIFEQLINNAHAEAQKKRFAEKKYLESRMEGKIKLLENFLPAFLVENRSMYGILSKGIHELEEVECLKYFDTVKIGIEQILDEKIISLERKEKAEAARKALQLATQSVSKPVQKIEPPQLLVIKAVYGVPGQDKDVTGVLQQLVKDGKISTSASNALVPDPAPGIPKFLDIEYEYKGKKFIKKYNENDAVNIP